MNRKNEKFKTLIPGGLCPRPSEANGYWGGGWQQQKPRGIWKQASAYGLRNFGGANMNLPDSQ